MSRDPSSSTDVASSPALTHERANELLGAYVDGTLPGAACASMEAHIESCAECQSERDALRAAMESVGGLHKLEAPPDFAALVTSRIRRRSRGRFFAERRPRFRIELFSVVMLVVLFGVYFVLRWASPALLNLR